MDINVIYEDNHIIVCIKPAGVLSQAGEMGLDDMVNLLKQYLKTKYDKPGNVYLGLVHRLDLNVEGIMVFAKTSKAASRLSEQVRERDFSKHYLAIVLGSIPNSSGYYSDYLAKDEEKREAIIANSHEGKLARLSFEVIDKITIEDQECSLVKIELETGRFHQIRFQMAYHGNPLLGDTKYGKMSKNPDFFLGLYAYRIEFFHPISKELMSFKSKPENRYFNMFKGLEKIDWRTK